MKALYEAVIEGLGEGIIALNGNLEVLLFNQKAEELTGLPSSHVIGRPVSKAFPSNRWIEEMAGRALVGGYTLYDHERELQKPDGSSIPVGVSLSPFYLEGERGVAIALKDLSGLKPLVEEERGKERLAFLGTLVAGIAHEVKNPMSGLKGAIQLLSRRIEGDDLKEYVRVMEEEIERIDRLLERLLTFSRPGSKTRKKVNVHEILDHAISIFLEEAEKRGVSFLKVYDPSIPPIRADRDGLIQVFVNLIKNSLEAIEGAGRIEVRTRVGPELIVLSGKERRLVSVEIIDSGKGIDKETMDKAFTPFYSTKEGGTGLGLPLSLRIVHEHGGLMRLERLEMGTKAVVMLPLIKD